MHYRLTPDESGLGQGLNIIEERLTRYGLKRKEITKSMLAAEEVMSALLEHADNADYLHLSLRRVLDEISIEIAIPGREFSFEKDLNLGISPDIENVGPETERAIRSMILKSFVDDLKYRYRSGMNTVRISVLKSKRAMLYKTLGAMLLAVVMGVLLKSFAPESFYLPVNDNILVPVKTMFMNALKMIVAPVVFFSIVSCIGQFSDLSEMGKIGGKTIAFYLFTTLLATALGAGVYFLFQPGAFGSFVPDSVGASVAAQEVEISMKDMLVNIVPGNFIKPFLEADMLQLIFLTALCGIAVGMIGKYAQMLSDLFTAFNELFLKITVLIIQFMPLAAFCSILSMILKTGTEAIVSILGILGVFTVGIVLMMVVYCLLMLVFAGLNPIPFCKKYAPTMAQVFSMGSSNASLPVNMDACKKLGVSPKVYSLSLPLGATVNMDGTCVYLSVFALALARLCGVTIPPAALLSVLISIIVLSAGAPGIPGSGLVCLSVLLAQINVPIEAVALVMGIDPLIGMMRCMSNCLGDVAVSTIVAKQEGILDLDIYKKADGAVK
ncbi:MAG: cation:dicarboxylase symporter family transporter [Clostridia bacterium]|nr:cation:dicarboxylase symporter family transporter [Clostridia bacterium]